MPKAQPQVGGARAPDSRARHRVELVASLFGGVAHEINNPVQSIMNYAQLLRGRLGDAALIEFADEIFGEARRIAATVQNVQGLVRDGDGMTTELALPPLVQDTLSLMSSLLHREGIRTEVASADDLPRVMGRSQDLRHLVLILLCGARAALNHRYERAHPEKRIAVRLEARTSGSESWVRLSVADWGTPIPEESLARIFEPDSGIAGRDADVAEGLSIGREIVEEHGARVSVTSGPTGPTSFSVDLRAVTRGG